MVELMAEIQEEVDALVAWKSKYGGGIPPNARCTRMEEEVVYNHNCRFCHIDSMIRDARREFEVWGKNECGWIDPRPRNVVTAPDGGN